METQTTNKEQVTKDSEEYKKQATENARADNPGIGRIDIADKADNKTDKICADSNNRDL